MVVEELLELEAVVLLEEVALERLFCGAELLETLPDELLWEEPELT